MCTGQEKGLAAHDEFVTNNYTVPWMTPSNTRPTELFPERLRTARNTRGLSQDALAEKADLQPSAISHFETGSRKPSFDNLRRLADALSVTTDYLIGRVDEMEALVTDVATADRIHRHLNQLTGEDLDFAELFLQSLADKASRKGDRDKK
jgi:transcriptional regulator with XRE-family HTH domain